ncbi:MAG TPA: cobalamin-binding protein [Candidatus Methylomirabilis sp.]|nr:cobalamin-binding protein [Candidatus Methylomirabilis sp.]
MRRAAARAVWTTMVLALGILAGGSPARAAVVPDMLGRSVSVPDGPLRVVSLAPSLTEIVFALGRGDWLVGVTEFCDYPPEALSKPRVGGPVTPDLERILALRPSLVLITEEGNPLQSVARLRQLGLPVFAVTPESFGGVLTSLQSLGRVLQAEAAAAKLVQRIQARAAAVQQAVQGRRRPRVLYLVWSDPLVAAGPASFVGDLLEMAGGKNIVRERAVAYPHLGWEAVVGRAPEAILVAEHGEPGRTGAGAGPLRSNWSRWQSIPAVRSGRVLELPGDTILRPGPRVGDGLEALARAIHPEAFGRPGSP